MDCCSCYLKRCTAKEAEEEAVEESRDKGGDWVPALRALWDAAEALLLEDDLSADTDYRSSMDWLREVSGAGPLP